MNLLYISNTSRVQNPYLDPSVRYRCYNFAEEFIKNGYVADVISYENFHVKLLDNYDIFIFHRPPYDKKIFKAIEILNQKAKLYFADYDDLIFNDKHAEIAPIYKQGIVSLEKCVDIFQRNEKALQLFSNIIVSTNFLKLKVLQSHPSASVLVLHNALSSNMLNQLKLKNHQKKPSKIKTISYLSGTASHNSDFSIVEDVLSELELKYTDKINIVVVGPLEFSKSKFKNIIHKRYVEYERLFDFIAQTDINIAPLELNDFTNSKSGLKFFESGVLQVPSVVSPIDDMLRFQKSNAIAYASTQKEWFDALERMICDDKYYEELSHNSFEYVKKYCTVNHTIKVLYKEIERLS